MSVANHDWLAIDVGNTRTKWGLGDVDRWVAHGSLPTAELAGLEAALPALPATTRAVACCVAGHGAEASVAITCRGRGIPLHIVTPEASLLGVRNGYDRPTQLGADRWAALVAAHSDQACNQLVVAAGTALTVDALRADGRFLGGIIVPGLALMRQALREGTAGLRPTGGRVTELPCNTDDAIATGTVFAACGAVDRIGGAMRGSGAPPARIVLTGGAAASLAPCLMPSPSIREHLVLDGLARIARTLQWPG